MPQISEEYLRKALEFMEKHKDSYTPTERKYITENFARFMKEPFACDILRQIYEEVGITDEKTNMYEGFLRFLEARYDIDTDIIEVAGGIIPSLAKKLALRQKKGTVTVYDPRLITNIDKPDNLILKKEKFDKNTSIGNAKLIIGFMPGDVTPTIIRAACDNQIDFAIGTCDGGKREGYEWLEYDDEWTEFVKAYAGRKIAQKKLGTLEEASLAEYKNPHPIIYLKQRKS